MKKFVLKIISIYLGWRLMLFFVTVFGLLLVTAPGNSDLHQPILDVCQNVWNWWDGGFFHDIAASGYHEPPNSAFGGFPVRTAFFPMFPFLIRIISSISRLDLSLVQLIIPFVAMGIAAIFIGLLVKKIADEKTALLTILAMLLFPFSYFFAAGYSEAVFLMLVAGFFYFLLARKNYWYASIFAAGASATRPVGSVLALVMLISYLRNDYKNKKFRDIFPFIISILGPFVYMFYLKIRFGNPLIFLEAQRGWRQSLGGNFIASLYKSFSQIYDVSKTIGWSLIFFERLSLFIAIIAGIYLLYRQRGKYLELAVYLFISILLPLITGTFGSLNRLIIVIFPIYFAIALIGRKRPVIVSTYLMLSGALLVIWTIFYTHSIWTG